MSVVYSSKAFPCHHKLCYLDAIRDATTTTLWMTLASRFTIATAQGTLSVN